MSVFNVGRRGREPSWEMHELSATVEDQAAYSYKLRTAWQGSLPGNAPTGLMGKTVWALMIQGGEYKPPLMRCITWVRR